ncbi:MAG: hypothetical protein IJX35_03325 [Candidatus Methanomethylophilaceae archaeon]|nr:hypothetical protein [Candidatus Methanomethylophilaceae archaeon]
MDFLGAVEERTCDGRLIVQCNVLPEIGDPVFDRKQNRIGTVGRVFGPVDGPYASVSTDRSTGTNVPKGTELFFKGRTQNGKGKRRNRRD